MEPVRAAAAPKSQPQLPFVSCTIACSTSLCITLCSGACAAHARLQSVLFNLKTKQPSGAAGAVSFEVARPAMEQLAKDLAAIEQAVLQASK